MIVRFVAQVSKPEPQIKWCWDTSITGTPSSSNRGVCKSPRRRRLSLYSLRAVGEAWVT
jgi:hypothetical protein